jgi:hypothetical protein
MVIHHLCARCRHESGRVEISGGLPGMMDFMLHGAMSRPAICMRCGGWVYSVKDDEVLPYEFIPSSRRLLKAAIHSAIKIPILWWCLSMLIVLPAGDPPVIDLWPAWIPYVVVPGALMGFSLPWAIGQLAKRNNVNEPHPPGLPPPGEFRSWGPFFIPAAVIAVCLYVLVVGGLAASGTVRGGVLRGIVGLIAAVVAQGSAGYDTFRIGRKPVPPASLRFGRER